MLAAKREHEKIIKMHVHKGADPDGVDYAGAKAIERTKKPEIRKLLKKGTNKDLVTSHVSIDQVSQRLNDFLLKLNTI